MSETEHEPEYFPDQITLREHVQRHHQLGKPKSPSLMSSSSDRFGPGDWCFCGPGSEKMLKYNEERPSYQFAKGGWDHLALRLTKERRSVLVNMTVTCSQLVINCIRNKKPVRIETSSLEFN